MLRQVSSGYAKDGTAEPGTEDWGLYLSAYNGARDESDDATGVTETAAAPEAVRTDVDGNEAAVLYPDAKGQLRQWHSDLYEYIDRELPYHAVISETVFERMRKASPLYAPQSLFNHHRELNEKRKVVSAEIDDLAQTQSENFSPLTAKCCALASTISFGISTLVTAVVTIVTMDSVSSFVGR